MSMRLTTLKNQIMRLEIELKHAQENNERVQIAKEQFADVYGTYSDADEYRKNLKRMSAIMTIAINKYRSNAILLLEQKITNCLQLVFPDEHYRAKIDWKVNTKTGEPAASLMIGKLLENGEYDYMPPALQNGGLAKQLISFASVSSILTMMGCRCIFLDEAFCSGDSLSLMELAPLLISLMDQGVQFIGIEHKMDVFSDVPNRVFELRKNRASGAVSIVSVSENQVGITEQALQIAHMGNEGDASVPEDQRALDQLFELNI